MLTCREILDFLSDYWSGELTRLEKARFDEHLAVCPSCVNYLEQYGRTVQMGIEAHAEEGPDAVGIPPELIRAILDTRTRKG